VSGSEARIENKENLSVKDVKDTYLDDSDLEHTVKTYSYNVKIDDAAQGTKTQGPTEISENKNRAAFREVTNSTKPRSRTQGNTILGKHTYRNVEYIQETRDAHESKTWT
jgi:hypothetical protein